MAQAPERDLPARNADERELLLDWLAWLRQAVLGKIDGLSEADARWTPDGRLLSLLVIVNHLTNVERRWIDGTMRGGPTTRATTSSLPAPSSPSPAPWRRTGRER